MLISIWHLPGNPTYDQNPLALDKELVTRSSLVCGGGKRLKNEYNLGLHIVALFVILIQSSLACVFPLMSKKFRWLRVPPVFLFYARHFGTGVLIATAFVHLLPTAFISLLDPCLSPFWNKKYPSMPGAIAMGAVFFVAAVEMVFARGRMCGKNLTQAPPDVECGIRSEAIKDSNVTDNDSGRPHHQPGEDNIGGVEQVDVGVVGNRGSWSLSTSHGLQTLEKQQVRGYEDNVNTTADISNHGLCQNGESTNQAMNNSIVLTPEQIHKKALLQCVLLEIGILFHSVFIGMTLSVTAGPGFLVLFIAIIFHQTFEGLALGSRIAILNWKAGQKQPWLMALTYALTTPIGQAIGLATHTIYSPLSRTGLLMVGIMNAISSGFLVFAGLVELLAEDFLTDDSWRELKGKKRVVACILVSLGAIGMATVGAWA